MVGWIDRFGATQRPVSFPTAEYPQSGRDITITASLEAGIDCAAAVTTANGAGCRLAENVIPYLAGSGDINHLSVVSQADAIRLRCGSWLHGPRPPPGIYNVVARRETNIRPSWT
jgi:hypothetical protein